MWITTNHYRPKLVFDNLRYEEPAQAPGLGHFRPKIYNTSNSSNREGDNLKIPKDYYWTICSLDTVGKAWYTATRPYLDFIYPFSRVL